MRRLIVLTLCFHLLSFFDALSASSESKTGYLRQSLYNVYGRIYGCDWVDSVADELIDALKPLESRPDVCKEELIQVVCPEQVPEKTDLLSMFLPKLGLSEIVKLHSPDKDNLNFDAEKFRKAVLEALLASITSETKPEPEINRNITGRSDASEEEEEEKAGEIVVVENDSCPAYGHQLLTIKRNNETIVNTTNAASVNIGGDIDGDLSIDYTHTIRSDQPNQRRIHSDVVIDRSGGVTRISKGPRNMTEEETEALLDTMQKDFEEEKEDADPFGDFFSAPSEKPVPEERKDSPAEEPEKPETPVEELPIEEVTTETSAVDETLGDDDDEEEDEVHEVETYPFLVKQGDWRIKHLSERVKRSECSPSYAGRDFRLDRNPKDWPKFLFSEQIHHSRKTCKWLRKGEAVDKNRLYAFCQHVWNGLDSPHPDIERDWLGSDGKLQNVTLWFERMADYFKKETRTFNPRIKVSINPQDQPKNWATLVFGKTDENGQPWYWLKKDGSVDKVLFYTFCKLRWSYSTLLLPRNSRQPYLWESSDGSINYEVWYACQMTFIFKERLRLFHSKDPIDFMSSHWYFLAFPEDIRIRSDTKLTKDSLKLMYKTCLHAWKDDSLVPTDYKPWIKNGKINLYAWYAYNGLLTHGFRMHVSSQNLPLPEGSLKKRMDAFNLPMHLQSEYWTLGMNGMEIPKEYDYLLKPKTHDFDYQRVYDFLELVYGEGAQLFSTEEKPFSWVDAKGKVNVQLWHTKQLGSFEADLIRQLVPREVKLGEGTRFLILKSKVAAHEHVLNARDQ